MKNEEPPSLAPTNNSTKWAQTTATAHLRQPPTNNDCPPQHETGTTSHERRQLHASLNHSRTTTTHHTTCTTAHERPATDMEHPPLPSLTNNDCPSHKTCTTAHEQPATDMERPPLSSLTAHHTKHARPPTNDLPPIWNIHPFHPHWGACSAPRLPFPLTFRSSQGCTAVSIDTCTALARFIGHV
jgi:hypothetical protein